MMRCTLFLLCLMVAATASAAAEHSPRPGGIAIVDVGTSKLPKPDVSYGSKPALVVQTLDRWNAVIGIPLDTQSGEISVRVNGIEMGVTVADHAYAEQRLTVKNQSYVTPDQAQLDRIGRERKIIDGALNNFREVAVDGVVALQGVSVRVGR